MARTAKKTEDAMENAAMPENAESVVRDENAAMDAGAGSLESAGQPETVSADAAGNDDAAGDPADGEESQDASAGEKTEQAPVTGACPSGLETINVLANRHRLPSWQLAALLRMMDWEDDLMVTDADFRAAIDRLNNRRIGGGRLA